MNEPFSAAQCPIDAIREACLLRFRPSLCGNATGLDNSRSKFRILKNYRVETRAGNLGLERETSDILRQRLLSWPLTSGNVAASVSARNSRRETALAGWASRIRTAMCRIRAGLRTSPIGDLDVGLDADRTMIHSA